MKTPRNWPCSPWPKQSIKRKRRIEGGGEGGPCRHVTHALLFVYKFRYLPRIANEPPAIIVWPVHGHTRLPIRTDWSWLVPLMPYPYFCWHKAHTDRKSDWTTRTHTNTNHAKQLFWKLVHYTLAWTMRAVSVLYQYWWMTSGTRVAGKWRSGDQSVMYDGHFLIAQKFFNFSAIPDFQKLTSFRNSFEKLQRKYLYLHYYVF